MGDVCSLIVMVASVRSAETWLIRNEMLSCEEQSKFNMAPFVWFLGYIRAC